MSDDTKPIRLHLFTQQVHPATCPNRGDGRHQEREGRDLGELVSEGGELRCLDCDYRQGPLTVHPMHAECDRLRADNARLRAEVERLTADLATAFRDLSRANDDVQAQLSTLREFEALTERLTAERDNALRACDRYLIDPHVGEF